MMNIVRTALALLVAASSFAHAAEPRSEKHQKYAGELWSYVTQTTDYTKWSESASDPGLEFAPPAEAKTRFYANGTATSDESLPEGSVIVSEHYGDDGQLIAVTVYLRAGEGYDDRHRDWYWAHFLPDGTPIQTSADRTPHVARGFAVFEEEGRLWVFRLNSPELADFLKHGELAQHVIRPGAGPGGVTLKSPGAETIEAYLASAPHASQSPAGAITRTGPETTVFEALNDEGRLWVFRKGSEELAAFKRDGELAKHVTRPGAGPGRVTMKAPDAETINDFVKTLNKQGFVVKIEDGRLWVFREGSAELKEFETNGELAKQVIRTLAGPGGLTIKAPDAETIDAYLRS